jgi:hypothetical protein
MVNFDEHIRGCFLLLLIAFFKVLLHFKQENKAPSIEIFVSCKSDNKKTIFLSQ